MKSFEIPSEQDRSPESLSSEDEKEARNEEYGTPEFDPEKIDPEKLRGKIDEALEEASEDETRGG